MKRHRSVVTDSLGRIWFSTNRGISVVDPARLVSASAPAIAQVQAISADGTPMDLRGPIRIPAGSHEDHLQLCRIEPLDPRAGEISIQA